MTLRFEVRDDGSGVFVYPDDEFGTLAAEFDQLLDLHQSGKLADKPYVAALEKLIARDDRFIDAHAHLAGIWLEQGKPKKALEPALAGLAVANRLIPEGFQGQVAWSELDNRPFLRALHIAVLAYAKLRRHREAYVLGEKMLAYNPGDNQGMRWLLGSEALRASDHERALTILASEAQAYPPYFYELALAHTLKGNWIAAATALRRGFVANPYIAEILCGNPDPRRLVIWHGSDLEERETAFDYLQMYGDLWRRMPAPLEFVHWLFHHPKVMVERAAVMDCREALMWEQDFHARGRILDREREVLAGIDDRLSAALIVKRRHRAGFEIYPWAFNAIPG